MIVDFPKKDKRGKFFAVDKRCWDKAWKTGYDAALAYIFLACGAGRDHRTTSWSAESIAKYTRLTWRQGKAGINKLIESGLVRCDNAGLRKRPRYYVMPAHQVRGIKTEDETPEWIWLPNALVVGAADETPPVELVRGSGRKAALRLLVDLYDVHRPQDIGGIHWNQLRRSFAREKVGEQGIWIIWSFTENATTAWSTAPFVKPHLTGKNITKPNGNRQDFGWQVFWDALEILTMSGLIEFAEHVIDSEDGAIISPCAKWAGEPAERKVGYAMQRFAAERLADWQLDKLPGDVHLVAASRLKTDIQMVGIGRLKYRPHTSATAAWVARQNEWEALANQIDAGGLASTAYADIKYVSSIYQVGIK